MKFDVIVVGGGLSGVVTALKLQKAGRKTALVSFGECTMYLGSGCIGVGALENVPEEHPYSKIPAIKEKAAQIPAVFADAGLKVYGDGTTKFRVSQVGNLLPCEYAFSENVLVENAEWLQGRKVVVSEPQDAGVNFPSSILAARLEAQGATCAIVAGDVDGFLAKHPDYQWLNVLPTPPSAEGFRVMGELRRAFAACGGTILKGDKATQSIVISGAVQSVFTENLGYEEPLQANYYVLATGSFFSKGLVSTYTNIYEPLFDADVDFPQERGEWVDGDFYAAQKFMTIGVKTDGHFRVVKDGEVIENLYAVGSILGGADRVEGQCSEGIDILTALTVVEEIENARKQYQ